MDAKDLVVWALEATLFHEPRRPGLTPAELVELGAPFGLNATSIDHVLRGRATEGGRVIPFGVDPSFFSTYDGDLRNVRAFDHVMSAFKSVAEAAGQRPPIVDRDTVIGAGVDAGLAKADLELAVATYRAFEGVAESEPRWELRRIKPTSPLPSAQREGPAGHKVTRRERYAELVERVGAVVQRRRGPAPAASASAASAPAASAPAASAPAGTIAAARAPEPSTDDPRAAFRALLPSLGHGRLVAWWAQLSHDFDVADGAGAALSKCLLAATLAEIALTTACPKPRELKPDPKGKPARWGLLEMAKAASGIGVDEKLRARIERLYRARQRLNVAKILEQTSPVIDVTADEAHEATATLEATLRAVLASHERTRARK